MGTAVEDRRCILDRIIQKDDLLVFVAADANAVEVLQSAALNPLVVNEGATLAADIDNKIGIILIEDFGMLAGDRIGEQLEVVFCFTAYGEDRFGQRNNPRDAEL